MPKEILGDVIVCTGDSIDSRFSADLLSQHLEEKISVGDKRSRFRFSFFLYFFTILSHPASVSIDDSRDHPGEG